MIKCYRVNAPVAGVPVEFPKGKLTFNEMRVSTLGNGGNIFIASDSSETLTPGTRYEIAPNIDIPLKATRMDNLWLNATVGGDGLSIFAELEGD